MKLFDIYDIEEINLNGWNLTKDTATEKIYHKDGLEKRLQIFANYSLEENIKNGKLHGLIIGRMKQPFLHYPDRKSKIYIIENYKEGKEEGLFQSFYEDGARISQEWTNGQLHGKWQEWFGNGQQEKEENYSNGVLNGTQYQWYENGQLKLEEKFLKGVQTGESLKYLDNGLLKRKKSYQKGKIEGVVYELWDFKGKVIDGGVYSKTEYKNDMPHGTETVFFSNGSKMREGTNIKAKEEGKRIWWHTNGCISIKEFYKNGELDGERLLYDEQGKLESVQKYSNGERIS